MKTNNTLLERLDTDGGNYVSQRTAMVVSKGQTALEESVGSKFIAMRDDLATLGSEKVFDIYIETDDIDSSLVEEYMGLVKRLQQSSVRFTDDGLLRKLAHNASEWYHEVWDDCYGIEPIFVLLSAMAVGVPSLLMGCLGSPLGIPAIGLLGYSLFIHKTDLQGESYKFNQNVTTVVQDAYRLNYLAQVMERETADIACLDDLQIESLKSEHGGTEGVIRYLESSQNHARNVRDYTGRILQAAGVIAPILTPEYISTGLRSGYRVDDLGQQIEELEQLENVVALSS